MKNQEKIQYTINNIDYVLITYIVRSEYMRLRLVDRMRKYNCILQKAEHKSGFFVMSHTILDILVPEGNLYNFNLDGLN